MPNDKEFKSQRDRFLAFSFAGADLLLEIDPHKKIAFAMGATKTLLGVDDKDLYHSDFLSIFAENDQPMMSVILDSEKVATKQGPYLVTLVSPKDKSKFKHVFLNSFKFAPEGNISIAIAQGDTMLKMMGLEDDGTSSKKILDTQEFEQIIRKKLADRISKKQNTNVQLLQLANFDALKKEMEADSWSEFVASLGQIIMTASLDGESAVKVDDGKYMMLNDDTSSEAALHEKIAALAKSYDVDIPLDLATRDITADPDALNARETTRAIMYTLKKMEKSGVDSVNDNLKESFGSYLKENAQKIVNLKRIISHQEFTIHFQPIVMLENMDISHHEVLVRFDNKVSPYEMIVMGEEIGISPDIDLSVCRQTIKYIDQNKDKKVGHLAVNLSGASIQNDVFLNKLVNTLKEYPDQSKNILFEITESSEIKDLEKVNNFIQELRRTGYPVCLDDFGAGAASFQYLQKLEVDGVKIDGSYIKTILDSPRDATMVKNITKMCHELDVYVVAEMIETKEQSDFLIGMGVDKGQGWLFSKAMPDVVEEIKLTGTK